jgi:hypothetical protein
MDSKLSPAQADPLQDMLLAPKDWTDAEKKLCPSSRRLLRIDVAPPRDPAFTPARG